MGWCNDISFPSKYNKLFKIEKKVKHEKLKRQDYKYDLQEQKKKYHINN